MTKTLTLQPTYQHIQQNLSQGMHNLQAIASDLLIILLVLAIPVYCILFTCSLQKTMSLVPREKRLFPNWFIWMRLIPLGGLIFSWLMLPFGIPSGLRNVVSGNKAAVNEASRLGMIGLAFLVVDTVVLLLHFMAKREIMSRIPLSVIGVIFIVLLATSFSLQIVYWINIVSFRKNYFAVNNTDR